MRPAVTATADSTSRIDDRRWRAVADGMSAETPALAAGVDDRGDAGYGKNRHLRTVTLSHQARCPLYLAVKVRGHSRRGNRQPGSFSTDGNRAINLYGHL